MHLRLDQITRMIRGELLGLDRHGNRMYAFDVLPGIVVERFEETMYRPQDNLQPATQDDPLEKEEEQEEKEDNIDGDADGPAMGPMVNPVPNTVGSGTSSGTNAAELVCIYLWPS
jgi:hypothetical protein